MCVLCVWVFMCVCVFVGVCVTVRRSEIECGHVCVLPVGSATVAPIACVCVCVRIYHAYTNITHTRMHTYSHRGIRGLFTRGNEVEIEDKLRSSALFTYHTPYIAMHNTIYITFCNIYYVIHHVHMQLSEGGNINGARPRCPSCC